MSVLHNIHVLEGGEVVGIQGTKLYSPYKEIGVKSLVKAMSVTKKTVDSMNGIPSAIDFVIEYGDRMKETDRESAENEWIETFRNRPPFLFVHPLLFTFFGGDTKVNIKDASKSYPGQTTMEKKTRINADARALTSNRTLI